jgi:hypothetical protein
MVGGGVVPILETLLNAIKGLIVVSPATFDID